MKNYYRVMLGAGSSYANEGFNNGFIGTDFNVSQSLSGKLAEDWRTFNREFIPIWLQNHPGKSKVVAGLACGALWTVSKGIHAGDMVLSPNGSGGYRAGEIIGDYEYKPGEVLQHRRQVRWLPNTIDRSAMTEALKKSAGSMLTVCDLTRYASEIETLIGGERPPTLTSSDETVEDPAIFALEKHLEEFLIANWSQTELGREYEIYQEDGELVGQQYPTDTGPIDILAISKNKKELLVIELKKGRASDSVVGQLQRYMGYVIQELAEKEQQVRGIIIALDDDLRIRRALAAASNIIFYRYEVKFRLFKA